MTKGSMHLNMLAHAVEQLFTAVEDLRYAVNVDEPGEVVTAEDEEKADRANIDLQSEGFYEALKIYIVVATMYQSVTGEDMHVSDIKIDEVSNG